MMKQNIFLLTILIIGSLAQGQVIDSTEDYDIVPTRWEILKQDGSDVVHSVGYAYSRPFHWQKKDFMILGGVAAVTAGIVMVDKPIHRFFKRMDDDLPSGLKDFGYWFGKPLPNYFLTGSIYSFGLLTKNEKVKNTGLVMISSVTAAGMFQTFTKTIAGRARPSADKGTLYFDMFSDKAKFHSFPSGHVILSSTTAYVLSTQSERRFFKYFYAALGLATPLQRLSSGAHWMSDIGLGVATCFAMLKAVDSDIKKRQENRKSKLKINEKDKVSWRLVPTDYGMALIGKF